MSLYVWAGDKLNRYPKTTIWLLLLLGVILSAVYARLASPASKPDPLDGPVAAGLTKEDVRQRLGSPTGTWSTLKGYESWSYQRGKKLKVVHFSNETGLTVPDSLVSNSLLEAVNRPRGPEQGHSDTTPEAPVRQKENGVDQ